MASTAFDSPDAEAATRPRLSTHPAFPAIVALWFAALLGLGSLVLPAALFERPFAAVGLSWLVPLGFVTRSAIALIASAGGALAGLAIARRIADGQAHRAASERPSHVRETPRRPLNVREDLDEPEDAPVVRRRARSLLAAEPAYESFDAPPPVADDYAEPEPTDGDGSAAVGHDEHAASASDGEASETRLEMPAPADAEDLDFGEPPAQPRPEAMKELREETSAVQPAIAPEAFRSDWAEAAPDQLGLVQLVERLGSSLERRREWLALAPAAAEEPEAAPSPTFDAAPAEEAAQAIADYFGRSFAPLHAVPDESEADDTMPALSLPSAVSAALEPFMPEDAGLDEDDNGNDDDGSFGSLLAMRGPSAAREADAAAAEQEGEGFEEPAVRPFDPPVATASPEARIADTDAQLREALAALQRMRGAA